MKFRIFWLATVLGIVTVCCDERQSSQTRPLAASLDSVMKSLADTAGFNGNVLVSKNGHIAY